MKISQWFQVVGAVTVTVGMAIHAPVALADSDSDLLVVAKAADPQTLDPAQTMDNNDWTVTYPLYQRLVRYDVSEDGKGLTSVVGELASSWTASADGTVWTFDLASGNAFSDGAAVDAAAVEYSFNRLMDLGRGPSEAFPGGMKVEASGEMQVTFTLEQPFAPFLYTLANNGAGIVNPAVEGKGGDHGTEWLSGNSAGSGAYMLTGWERGQSLVLEPNPHYGGAVPSIEKVRVDIIAEAAARRLKLEAGDVHIAESLPVDQLDALDGAAGIEVQNYPSLKVTYLYLNNKVAPLDNVDVRRAISNAVDYQGIIDGILDGNGVQMRGPIPEGMWGQNKAAIQYSYDLDAAKKALSMAGGTSEEITFLYSDRDPLWEPIAIATQAYLSQLGLNVKLEKLANATMRERFDTGEFGIATGNWSPDFADPYMFTNYWFDSKRHGLAGNRSWYSNDKVDGLLQKAVVSSDPAERAALYGELQEIVTDEAAYVYLFQKDYRIAVREDVAGFVFNPMLEDIFNFGSMSLSK